MKRRGLAEAVETCEAICDLYMRGALGIEHARLFKGYAGSREWACEGIKELPYAFFVDKDWVKAYNRRSAFLEQSVNVC